MKYKTLKEKAERLCKKINPNTTTEEPEDIDDLEVKRSVLLLGLNPSNRDELKTGKKADCFLKYMPKDKMTKKEQKIIESMRKKMYFYNSYFKKNYQLFCDLGFNMLWQNQDYLNRHKGKLEKEEYEFLNSERFKPKTNDYIIFSDLIFIKEKNAKKIEKELEKYKQELLELFDAQLEYYKPNLVVITNAKASELVGGDKKIEAEMEYKKISILFSSMVSGQRALDRFNFVRLKRDIKKHLRGKPDGI